MDSVTLASGGRGYIEVEDMRGLGRWEGDVWEDMYCY